MTRTFGSSWNRITVTPEPDGRIAVETFNRDLPVFRETLSTASAKELAEALTDAVKEVTDAGQ
ncbi:hypothetical protein AB0J48_20710 [Nocardia salmonicida]|uniref:hypothetical protein n=1 Tax=Nocardia salmonicida TaxID=53431 RepID=UPI00344906C2